LRRILLWRVVGLAVGFLGYLRTLHAPASAALICCSARTYRQLSVEPLGSDNAYASFSYVVCGVGIVGGDTNVRSTFCSTHSLRTYRQLSVEPLGSDNAYASFTYVVCGGGRSLLGGDTNVRSTFCSTHSLQRRSRAGKDVFSSPVVTFVSFPTANHKKLPKLFFFFSPAIQSPSRTKQRD
jgi:hypothetical protein